MTDTLRRRVRPNNPSTSWEAAAAQTTGNTAALQRHIYRALQHASCTYDELIEKLASVDIKATPSGVRTRTKELRDLGWVAPAKAEDGTTLRRQAAGRQRAIVWRACRPGERTGVDRREPDVSGDRQLDAFDLAALRAAVNDARLVYASAMRAAEAYPLAAVHTLAQAAVDMDARLAELTRVVLVPPAHDTTTEDLVFGRNDREERLF